MSQDVKEKLIRLGNERPELREHLSVVISHVDEKRLMNELAEAERQTGISGNLQMAVANYANKAADKDVNQQRPDATRHYPDLKSYVERGGMNWPQDASEKAPVLQYFGLAYKAYLRHFEAVTGKRASHKQSDQGLERMKERQQKYKAVRSKLTMLHQELLKPSLMDRP